MNQIELEEQYLEEEYSNGNITLKEYNSELRELYYRSVRACAEEAAQEAYDNEMGRW